MVLVEQLEGQARKAWQDQPSSLWEKPGRTGTMEPRARWEQQVQRELRELRAQLESSYFYPEMTQKTDPRVLPERRDLLGLQEVVGPRPSQETTQLEASRLQPGSLGCREGSWNSLPRTLERSKERESW